MRCYHSEPRLYSGSSEASVSGEVGEDSLAVWGLGGQFDRQESFIRSLFPETFDMTDIQCRTLYKLCQTLVFSE
jgi:hypothetical protein